MNPAPSSEAAINALNRAFRSDPRAIHSLICNRVPCNKALADDPAVVVGESLVLPGSYDVGVLGLINGVLAEMGLPAVAVHFSDADLDGRCRILGFCLYSASVAVDPQAQA